MAHIDEGVPLNYESLALTLKVDNGPAIISDGDTRIYVSSVLSQVNTLNPTVQLLLSYELFIWSPNYHRITGGDSKFTTFTLAPFLTTLHNYEVSCRRRRPGLIDNVDQHLKTLQPTPPPG